MNREEFDMLVNEILKIPHYEEKAPISAYGSVDVNELREVIQAFNKIPDYNILIKDNNKKRKEIEKLNNDIKVLLKENENKEKVIKAQDNIIKEVRELLNQEWYSVLRKETIKKAREILDKVNNNE